MITLEKLLAGLQIGVEPFALCRTAAGVALDVPSMDYATLHYVVAGAGRMTTRDGSSLDLQPGAMVILPPGMAHKLAGSGPRSDDLAVAKNCQPLSLGLEALGSAEGEDGIVVACSYIRATYQRVLGLFDYLPAPIMAEAGPAEALGKVMESVLAEMAEPKPGSAELIALLMQQCLVYVLRRYCESGCCRVPWLSALEDERLARALERMLDEPGRRFSVEMLANEVGMSRSLFAQRFREAFGRSPMDFLKELRLQHAAHLLRTSDRPIKSIADLVGFESRSHFSRSFTEYFGASPAEYRNTIA